MSQGCMRVKQSSWLLKHLGWYILLPSSETTKKSKWLKSFNRLTDHVRCQRRNQDPEQGLNDSGCNYNYGAIILIVSPFCSDYLSEWSDEQIFLLHSAARINILTANHCSKMNICPFSFLICWFIELIISNCHTVLIYCHRWLTGPVGYPGLVWCDAAGEGSAVGCWACSVRHLFTILD